MRVLISFVFLTVLASAMSAMVFENLSLARRGDSVARLIVFFSGAVATAAIVLLARIILKVSPQPADHRSG